MEDLNRRLRESSIFGGLRPEEMEKLAGVCTRRRVEAGEMLFREGEADDSLFLVLEGGIRIFRRFSESHEETLATLGPGEVFGEMSFVDHVSRSSSAMAMETSAVVELSRGGFDALSAGEPSLAVSVMKGIGAVIANRIRVLDPKIREATEWVRDIHRWSQWGLGQVAAQSMEIEIHIQGRGRLAGRVLDILHGELGSCIHWRDEEGSVEWTPYHAVAYLRVKS